MARADFAFSHRIRVRWSEVDPQRVVFNARYLDYADLAGVEYWRAVWQAGLWGEGEIELHIVKATVEYRAPIRGDEEIDLFARTARTGRTSVTSLFEFHGAGTEDLRSTVELVQVHVDLATGRPVPLPDWFAPAFAAFDARRTDL